MEEEVKQIIEMENELIKVANWEMLSLSEQLKPYLNQKILLADNKHLRKNITIKTNSDYNINPLKENDNASLNTFLDISEYGGICLNIRICFRGGNWDLTDKLKLQLRNEKDLIKRNELRHQLYKIKPYCVYKEKNVYLGQHEKGVLKEIEQYKKIDLLDYKTELNKLIKLKRLTEDYKQAKQEVNNCFEQVYKYF